MVVYLTQVDFRQIDIGNGRQRVAGRQYILSFFKENIGSQTQTGIKHFEVNTIILFCHLFPSHIRITHRIFFRVRKQSRTAVFSELPTALSFCYCIITAPCTCHIKETGIFHFIITYDTIRSTQFQEINNFLFLHEFLLRENPTGRNRWEKTEALIRCKIFRTVISCIQVHHISLLVCIRHTSHIPYIGCRYIHIKHFSVYFRFRIIFFRLVVQEQCRYIMVTE